MTTEAYRPTPRVTPLTEAFWTGGRLVSKVRDGKQTAGAKFAD